MKSRKLIAAIIIAFASIVYADASHVYAPQDTVTWKDGTYTGMSRAKYTGEPYWGKVEVIIDKGIISAVKFTIRDSALHEPFNLAYAKHFEGHPLYIQQTKNDWNGVQTYPRKAVEAQDLNKIDAISGATWSYNIFKAALEEALRKARKSDQ